MSIVKTSGALTTTVATAAGKATSAKVTTTTPFVLVARRLSNGAQIQRAFPNLDNLQAYLVAHADGHDIDPNDLNVVAIGAFTQ